MSHSKTLVGSLNPSEGFKVPAGIRLAISGRKCLRRSKVIIDQTAYVSLGLGLGRGVYCTVQNTAVVLN